MKTTLHLLTMLSLYSIRATAQDWVPFVPGTTYYYSQETGEGLIVDKFEMTPDAIGSSVYYFHDEPCYESIFTYEEHLQIYQQYYSSDKPLFAISDNDIITFAFLGPTRTALEFFDFRPASRPGTQWEARANATVRCVSEVETEVFGEMDSIRIFRCLTPPYDAVEFILSKSHGMIRFPPLRNFIELSAESFGPDYNLIGMHHDSLALGYLQPRFEDYFTLSPGDLLIWKESYVNYPFMIDQVIYSVDSILNVFQSNDTISYLVRTILYDTDGQPEDTLESSRSYYRQREGAFLEGPVGWFSRPVLPFNWYEADYWNHPLSLVLSEHDTTTYAMSQSAFIRNTSCYWQLLRDYEETYRYVTGKGLVHEHYFLMNGHVTKELVGSVINGVEDGETGIPASVRSVEVSGISVFPNPTTGMLFLRIPFQHDGWIRMYDVHGRLMMSDRANGSIDICGLQRGIYLCQILSGSAKEVFTTKIVKH